MTVPPLRRRHEGLICCEIQTCIRPGTLSKSNPASVEIMFRPPMGPIDHLYARALHLQKKPVIGRFVRQALKFRGIDIPPKTLSPGRGLFLRHGGSVVIHGLTRIGSNVMLHQGVTVGRGDIWKPMDPEMVGFVLEDNVILGANSVVVSSRGLLTVAEGTVLGANSVLTQSTGPYEIWAGSPARRVGSRER
jgi:serine O-acetyltransferase